MAELNEAIWALLAELDEREMPGYGMSRRELFETTEKPALRPLPETPFRFASWKKAKVNIDYHVEVKRHWYSVPFQLIHKRVEVRLTEHAVEVFFEGQRVACHVRDDSPGRHTTIKEHMPPSHQYMQGWTPSRFLQWAGKVGAETKAQVNSLLLSKERPEHSYRACLGLLGLEKKYGKERLEAACARANRLGIVSMRSVKNMLATGADRVADTKPEPVATPKSNTRKGSVYGIQIAHPHPCCHGSTVTERRRVEPRLTPMEENGPINRESHHDVVQRNPQQSPPSHLRGLRHHRAARRNPLEGRAVLLPAGELPPGGTEIDPRGTGAIGGSGSSESVRVTMVTDLLEQK